MKLNFSKTYSDEDGKADEAKLGMIYANKDDLLKICEFFEQVKNHISKNDICHLHLSDSFDGWKKGKHIDLEVNLDYNQ
ncbi:MAG: hypothetical protein WC121_11585 [Candidatus Kapaibacterium sp.]